MALPADDISQLDNSDSLPAVNYHIVFKKTTNPQSESPAFEQVVNVSNKMITEPNIVDSTDYRENLTYLNEIAINFNNEDGIVGSFLNEQIGTEIKVEIWQYLDMPGGFENKFLRYSGFVDLRKVKPDFVNKTIEVSFYSYFGVANITTGKTLTTRYIDDKGLILWETGLWLTSANLAGKVLKRGMHSIQTRVDGSNQVRLDEGPWQDLFALQEYTLSNEDDTERVKIYYEPGVYKPGETKLIVKNEGQFPETFYHNAPMHDIIAKCFNEVGATDHFLERYEMPTHDGRRVFTALRSLSLDSQRFDFVSVVSDGVSKFYIAVVENEVPHKNQIWVYDYADNSVQKVYETVVQLHTWYRLVLDKNDNVLYAFFDNPEEDSERGMIQKIFINFNYTYTTIFESNDYLGANPYERFQYSRILKSFLVTAPAGGSFKQIKRIDTNGTVTTILTDAEIVLNGPIWLRDLEGQGVELYFMKEVGGVRKIYRMNYELSSGTWTMAFFVVDWFDNGNYQNFFSYVSYNFNKALLIGPGEVRLFDFAGAFSGNLRPADINIYTPFDFNGKIYFASHNTVTGFQRIGYLESNGSIIYESEDIADMNVVQSSIRYQKLCSFINIYDQNDLGVIVFRPGILYRFSKFITPIVKGEYDTSGMSVRDVLQDLANNFLGFVKIDMNRKGWFVSRAAYQQDNTLTFKKRFIQMRVKEIVYNEKYDRVIVSNGNAEKDWGNRAIQSKVLSVSLELIPDEFLKDAAKYFFDYYSKTRKLLKIKYAPIYFNFQSLDKANLNELQMGFGKIHKVIPKKMATEFEILIEE